MLCGISLASLAVLFSTCSTAMSANSDATGHALRRPQPTEHEAGSRKHSAGADAALFKPVRPPLTKFETRKLLGRYFRDNTCGERMLGLVLFWVLSTGVAAGIAAITLRHHNNPALFDVSVALNAIIPTALFVGGLWLPAKFSGRWSYVIVVLHRWQIELTIVISVPYYFGVCLCMLSGIGVITGDDYLRRDALPVVPSPLQLLSPPHVGHTAIAVRRAYGGCLESALI